MPILHLFNLNLQLSYYVFLLNRLLIKPVYIFDGVLELFLESHVVSHDITDSLILNRVVHLELIEQLSRLPVQKCLALQILLIVVHFQFVRLQRVLFAVKLALKLHHLFLENRVLRIFLVLHVLDDLGEH